VAAQHGGQWRYALTDAEGQLILAGITRRRPTLSEGRIPAEGGGPAPGRGGVVELHIPAALLTELTTRTGAASLDGQWAAVITDIAAQYAASRARDPRDGVGRQDPTARFAGAVLRRHVQIRDRTCVHPGCRCPARHAELDHTIDHSRGGLTTDTNFGPVCCHDHQLKHEGGWRLTQPEPGHFIWTSPLGRIYHTRPQPITTDLPEPLPRPDHPDHAPPATAGDDVPILWRPPPDPPRPPARFVDPDEPPPF